MTGLEPLGGVHAVGGHLDSAGRALRSVTVECEVFHLTSVRHPCPLASARHCAMLAGSTIEALIGA